MRQLQSRWLCFHLMYWLQDLLVYPNRRLVSRYIYHVSRCACWFDRQSWWRDLGKRQNTRVALCLFLSWLLLDLLLRKLVGWAFVAVRMFTFFAQRYLQFKIWLVRNGLVKLLRTLMVTIRWETEILHLIYWASKKQMCEIDLRAGGWTDLWQKNTALGFRRLCVKLMVAHTRFTFLWHSFQ